jgi:hypothetical protein
MGLFDKLKFWKKEEVPEFELGKYPGLEAAPPGTAMPEMAPPGGPGITEIPHLEELGPVPPPPTPLGARPFAPPGMPAPSAFAPVPSAPAQDMTRDMQIVQAKLDTLKVLLDSINARLERMERMQQPKEEEAVPLAVRRWR